jgi:hypothetical protein
VFDGEVQCGAVCASLSATNYLFDECHEVRRKDCAMARGTETSLYLKLGNAPIFTWFSRRSRPSRASRAWCGAA